MSIRGLKFQFRPAIWKSLHVDAVACLQPKDDACLDAYQTPCISPYPVSAAQLSKRFLACLGRKVR